MSENQRKPRGADNRQLTLDVAVKESLAPLKRELEGVALPPDAIARGWQRLQPAPAQPRVVRARRWVVGGFAVAACAAAALLLWQRAGQPPLSPGSSVDQVAANDVSTRLTLGTPYTLAAHQAVADADLGVTVTHVGGVATDEAALLVREANGLRVSHGKVRIVARKRQPASPLRILVSGGSIEVLGTSFVVTERAGGGNVMLEEGRIRFVDQHGAALELAPGQAHAWGDADASLASPTATLLAPNTDGQPAVALIAVGPAGVPGPVSQFPAQSPPPPATPSRTFEQVVAEVDTLQARGDERGAIALLRHTLARGDMPAGFAEILRFELISSLARIKDNRALCQELAAYNRSHGSQGTPAPLPHGRFAVEIAGIAAGANCGAP